MARRSRIHFRMELDPGYQTAFLIMYSVTKVVEVYFIWRFGEKAGSSQATIAAIMLLSAGMGASLVYLLMSKLRSGRRA